MNHLPLYATVSIVVMVIAATFLLIFANPASAPSLVIVVGMIATTIPSLVAAVFSERTNRDLRNGVLKDKVKEGAAEALEESKLKNDE